MDSLDVNFNFRAMRAVKARFFASRGKMLSIVCAILAVVFLLGGVGLLVLEMPLGYLVASLMAWPLAYRAWLKQDLAKLAPAKNPRSLTDILDGDLLGLLPDNSSPSQIAAAVMKTNGGRFFAARLGVSAQYLPELCSANAGDTPVVWQTALIIHNSLADKTTTLNSATVTAALLKTQAEAASILPHLQIDADDCVAAAQWYAHLTKLIDSHAQPKMTGGIARDWSFGYIPTLERFGNNLSQRFAHGRSISTRLEAHEEIVQSMLDTFSNGGRQNAALIGPLGSGKSTIVEAFAEKLMDSNAKIPENLQYRQVISLDASSLLASAPGRGELEGLVNQVLVEAYTAKNIIICLDNAEMFFEEGTGSVDITNILLPILEGGALRLILTMDEQRFLKISQRNPALASALNRIQVLPPDEQDTIRILQDQLIQIEFQRKATYMYQAIKEAYRLSERYVQDVAQPKKAIQVLESAAGKSDGGLVTAQSVRDSIEATIGVKVGVTDDAGERDKLLNLEDLIHQRMINQVTAVNAVASALRRARAGVRSENRPIGTFLFLGPTGVGKTELAKSLADVYFGGEDHIVRVDLNEYVRSEDVARLIADGATDANSLAAQILKNPFSVVLLDEIEKAHTNVLTTLLQVLDEGIMRDINNREISFRDAIIVATSNAGADRIRQYIDAGYQLEQFQEQITNELIDTQVFRPEFLNRFDEIVVFRPLTKEELLKVVDLILKGINKNLALQKVSIEVDDDAKRALVDAGYDPRLGARPMRRIVQRSVENLVAQKMLSGELVAGAGMRITLADLQATGALENNQLGDTTAKAVYGSGESPISTTGQADSVQSASAAPNVMTSVVPPSGDETASTPAPSDAANPINRVAKTEDQPDNNQLPPLAPPRP